MAMKFLNRKNSAAGGKSDFPPSSPESYNFSPRRFVVGDGGDDMVLMVLSLFLLSTVLVVLIGGVFL